MRSEGTTIRRSAIAGTWYPGDASLLRRTIEEYLAQAPKVSLPGKLLALIVPHAGYVYSGQVAAHAYAQIRGAGFRRVIVLGPLHRPIWGSRLGPVMAPAEAAYRTPLGEVPVDRPFVDALGKQVMLTSVRRDEEHSLEIQLPFLQVVLGDFTLIPLMLGESIADVGVLQRISALAEALSTLSDSETLVVASTDLSHLQNYADVLHRDRRLADYVAAFDIPGLVTALQTDDVQACGATGLVAALMASQLRRATGTRVLALSSSGDVTGDKRPGVYTVGYLAAAVFG